MESSTTLVVTIIGFGNVGRNIAHILINTPDCQFTINIMDPSPNVRGSILDLGQATFLPQKHSIIENSREFLNTSDFIFYSAGFGVPPGGSRSDLSKRNCDLVDEIFKDYKPAVDAKIIAITNPVDNVAHRIYQASGLEASKVIGTGTLLDAIRMNYFLSKIKPGLTNLQSVLLGEHGPSIVVANSLSKADGLCLNDCFSKSEIELALQQTITAASVIKETQGASIYAIADCSVYIMRQIIFDTYAILPLGGLIPEFLHDKLDCTNIYLSLPSVINKDGMKIIEDFELKDEEWNKLKISAKEILKYQ